MIEPLVINQVVEVNESDRITIFDSKNYFEGHYPAESMVYIMDLDTSKCLLDNPCDYLITRFTIFSFWTEMKKNNHHLFCGFCDKYDHTYEYTFELEFIVDEKRPNNVFLVFYGYSNINICQSNIKTLMRRCGLELYRTL